jgi:hypothetical protein
MNSPELSLGGNVSTCQRICLTPTRNEHWIIGKFLAAASSWADHVIVADQNSTDGTLEALQSSPKVDCVINQSPVFNELERRRLLLDRARRIPGRRILFGLDADEAFSANSLESAEWKVIESAPPGTLFRFRWVNILPGFKQAWCSPRGLICGFVDDGSEHIGGRIHSGRIPRPAGAPVIELKEIVILHFQYVFWERMLSKQRWYQAWELHEHKAKGPLEIFRQYNHMAGGWPRDEIVPVQPEWLDGFESLGIDFRALQCEPVTWWDQEVLTLLRENGPGRFSRLAIWDKNWAALAAQVGANGVSLDDPRSVFEKAIHRLLYATQARRGRWDARVLERGLRLLGW